MPSRGGDGGDEEEEREEGEEMESVLMSSDSRKEGTQASWQTLCAGKRQSRRDDLCGRGWKTLDFVVSGALIRKCHAHS